MSEFTEATIGALSVGIHLLDEPDWGVPNYEDEETANIWADINTQLRRRASALVHKNVVIKLTGTSKDDLIGQENDLRRELRKEVNTLVVQPANASLATTFTILRNPAMKAPFNKLYESRCVAHCQTELVCEPWGYGDVEAPVSAGSYQSPTLVDLNLGTPFKGQGDVPLSTDLARDWGSANDGIGIEHAIVALAKPGAATISDYAIDAYNGVAGGDWSNATDAVKCASGHFAKLNTNDAWKFINLQPPTNLPAGRYRVFARCKTSSVTADNYVAMRKQAVTDRDPKTKTLLKTGDVWALYNMGEMAIYPGCGALRIFGYAGSGWFGYDRLYLVPIDWAWMFYDDVSQHSGAVHFGWLYDQLYALTDGSAPALDATGRMFGHGLKCGLDGFSLMVIVEQMDGNDPTPDYTLDVTYRPRWESFRDE